MALSKPKFASVVREQGPDTLRALKESLIQDSRIAALEDPRDVPALSVPSEAPVSKDYHQAPSITVSETPIRLAPHREEPQAGAFGADDLGNSLKQSSKDAIPHQTDLQSRESSRARPSINRRVFVIELYGLIVVAAVCAVILLPPDWAERSKDTALAWYSAIRQSTSIFTPSSPKKEPAQIFGLVPESTSTPASVVPVRTADVPAQLPAIVDSAPFVELHQQLEALASSLAAARGAVDQLTAKQDQMAQDIATLRASEQSLRQQLASLSPPAASRSRAHRRPRTVR